jgi:hypothetical protein
MNVNTANRNECSHSTDTLNTAFLLPNIRRVFYRVVGVSKHFQKNLTQSGLRIRGGYVSTLPAKTKNSAKICTLAQITPDVFYVCLNTYPTIYNQQKNV